MNRSNSKAGRTTAKPAKASKSGKSAKPAKATPPAKVKKPQDTSELRTLRFPWGGSAWLSEYAAATNTTQTAVVREAIEQYLAARPTAVPISEEMGALMRKVAKLARLKMFPGRTLACDPDPLSGRAAKELLKNPVARELYNFACEEMSRPTPAELAEAGL